MGYSEKRGLPAPIWLPGGKGNMIFKLPPLVPYGDDVRIYAEPYCGAASLFFAKKPHPIDVLNDLDQRLIGLFRTLQDPEKFSELKHRLLYTPYARAEFERALEMSIRPAGGGVRAEESSANGEPLDFSAAGPPFGAVQGQDPF
jgi:hypothetical protein